LWPWRERVIPIRADSLYALAEVFREQLVPDLIHLDTEHTYDRVSPELAFCSQYWPSTVIIGDDYNWTGVGMAAREHAQKIGRSLFCRGTAYCFR